MVSTSQHLLAISAEEGAYLRQTRKINNAFDIDEAWSAAEVALAVFSSAWL